PAGAVWAEVPEPRDVTEEKRTADAEREALRQSLLAGSVEGSPRWLAGELLEYHRREARPAWWWFFARCKMSSDELFEDGESIGRLRPETRPVAAKRSLDYRFSFPPQQHKLSPGDVPIDPATGKPAGTIQLVDEAAGVLVLRRGPSLASIPLPSALIPPKPHATNEARPAPPRLATRRSTICSTRSRTPPAKKRSASAASRSRARRTPRPSTGAHRSPARPSSPT